MMQLGGASIFLSAQDAGLGGRESTEDVARVIGGYSDVITLRTFSQKLIDTFIEHSGVAVINGLSDERHPCQALTDVFTMQEVIGDLQGKKCVFGGDGNNCRQFARDRSPPCAACTSLCAHRKTIAWKRSC